MALLKKKALPLFLAIVMIVTMVPVHTFASNDDAVDGIYNIGEDATVIDGIIDDATDSVDPEIDPTTPDMGVEPIVGLAGEGTEASPYLIYTAEDLDLFKESVNSGETKYNAPDVWVALADDIDLSGKVWDEGIGDGHNWSFDGCFEGNGYTISGLTIEPYADDSGYICGGLFGYIYGNAVIRNLVIDGFNVSTPKEGHNVGILVGFAYNKNGNAEISNITITDSTVYAPGAYGVGGIVGYSYYGKLDLVDNCSVSDSEIYGYSFVGGIVGYTYTNSTISNCSVSDTHVESSSYSTGGITGIALKGVQISNCTVDSDVSVSATANVGSVVGAITTSEFTLFNCNAAEPQVGGYYNDNSAVAALAGDTYYLSLQDAVNAGGYVLVLSDVTLEDTLIVPADSNVILNLNGHTVSQEKACTAHYEMIKNNGSLTITGDGVISFTDIGEGDPAFTWGSYTIGNYGTLVVDNGTIENLSNHNSNGSAVHMYCAIQHAGASVTINDGIISTPSYRSVRVNRGTLTINNGTFEGQIWMQPFGEGTSIAIHGGSFAPRGVDGSSVFIDNSSKTVGLTVTDGYFATKIGASSASALAGSIKGGVFTEKAKSGTAIALADGLTYNLDLDGTYFVAKPSLMGRGTQANPYLIHNVSDLILFRDSVNAGETKYNAPGVWVALASDIDLFGIDWSVNIGDDCNATFDGIFDGQNHTISNLTSNESAAKGDGYFCTGLFGAIYGEAEIRNLNLVNVKINVGEFTGNNAGALVGFAYDANGIIENVTVSNVTINATGIDGTGAIVGYAYVGSLTVSDCEVTNASINGRAYVGVIVGYSGGKTTISGCSVSGADVTAHCSVGGVTGILLNGGIIADCDVNDVTLSAAHENWQNSIGIASGTMTKSSSITVSNVDADNVNVSAMVGAIHQEKPATPVLAVPARIGDQYYGTLEAAMANVTSGDTVTILADVTLENSLTIAAGQTIVLDLNGHTVTGSPKTAAAYAVILNNGNLTVNNGSIVCECTLPASTSYAVNTITNTGILTVNNVTIENSGNSGQIGYGIDNNSTSNDAILTVNGGKIVAKGNYYDGIRQFCNNLTKSNSVTINGGDVSSIWMQNPSDGAGATNTKDVVGSLAINGGTISGVYLEPSTNFTCSITDGNIGTVYYFQTAEGRDLTGFITGGTFGSDPSAFVAKGFTATEKDGVWTVATAAAKIGDNYYATLADAFNAAQSGDEVEILTAGTYTLSTSGKDLTITGRVNGVEFTGIDAKNLGGANITFNNVTFTYAGGSTYKGLQHSGNLVYNNCTFNGQVFLYGASETFNNCTFNQTTANYNVWTYGAKVVVFNSCTFNCAGKSVLIYAESAGLFNDVTFTNCEFIATTAVDGKAAIEMDSSLTSGISLTINNATVTGFGTGNISGNTLWNNKKDNKTEANNDITVVVDGITVLKPWTPVASVNGVNYPTLQNAINAGGHVLVLSDITLDTIVTVPAGATVILDMNGHTITGIDNTTANFSILDNRGDLTITGNGVFTLTASVNSGWSRYSAVIANNPGGKLTVESGTIEHLGGTDMAYGIDNLTNGKGTYAETIINGGTIKSTYRAVRQFLNGVEAQNILTINGGIIEGANKSIFFHDPSTKANSGTLTVNSGAVLNGDVYLFVTAGSTEWPVSVSIDASALNGEVITGNIPAGYEAIELDGKWIATPYYPVYIGTQGYATLNDAIKAAVAGNTIVVREGTYTGDVSINKAITVVGEGNVVINGKVSLSGNGITLQNVTVSNPSGNAMVINGGNILVENCTITGSNGLRYCYASNGNVTLKNCTVTGGTYGVHFDGGSGIGNVIIDNCKITGWTSFGSAVEEVIITDTTFASGNYNLIRFYQNATLTNVVIPSGNHEAYNNGGMRIDTGSSGGGMEGITITLNNVTTADGSDVRGAIPNMVVVKSNVIIDGELQVYCEDANNDHKCDFCGETLSECYDADDHKCDICGETISECYDADDHKCDTCGETVSECADNNSDHNCDLCGTALTECADNNSDHNCDLCGKPLTECADNNGDHNCDLCGTALTECADNDNDHSCDLCGTVLSACVDSNSNHSCDICGNAVSICIDVDRDHVCNICGVVQTVCADRDSDHYCDLCDRTLTECADENSDHICDLCTVVLTECADENSDHNCDICTKALTECTDENSDHNCDICAAALTECADTDEDGYCDVCGKQLTVVEPQDPTDPEPSETPDPEPSADPEPSVTPDPEPSADPEPSVTPDPEPSADPEPSVTPDPEPSADPEPSNTNIPDEDVPGDDGDDVTDIPDEEVPMAANPAVVGGVVTGGLAAAAAVGVVAVKIGTGAAAAGAAAAAGSAAAGSAAAGSAASAAAGAGAGAAKGKGLLALLKKLFIRK